MQDLLILREDESMKIGVSSYSFINYMKQTHADYFKIADLAAEMGYDGIEFIDLELDVQPAESVSALAKAVKDHCDQLNLPIPAYTVHADFIDGEDEVARLCAQVDVAKILGAPVMRHDISWRRDIPWREMIEKTAPMVRQVADYAAGQGIRTCTENHGIVMQEAHRVEELILTVNLPNFGWLVDMGNFLCADEPPMHALPIAAPYAVHAHAKDFLMKSTCPSEEWFPTRGGNYLRGTVAGHGIVPIPECIQALKDAGYDGWLSLEFEGMEENLPALRSGLHYLRSVVG